VLRKDDSDWVKKCMEYEVEGARPRGRQRKLGQDAMDRNRWRKQIRFDDHDRCEWVNVSSGTGSPGLFWTKAREP